MMYDDATPEQKEKHEGFVRDFPVGQCVRYLPTNGVVARIRDAYWHDVFWETWVEAEVWDTYVADFRTIYILPAFLFVRIDEDRCHAEANTGEESTDS
jgi:hypothetical protein